MVNAGKGARGRIRWSGWHLAYVRLEVRELQSSPRRSTTSAPAEPSAGVDQRPPSPPEPTTKTYVLRPGSLERSTSLWWILPPTFVWIGIAAVAVVGHLIFPGASIGGALLSVLLVDLALTSAWAALILGTQNEKDTERGDGTIDPRGRHEFWRSRTVAWDLLAVGAVGTVLVAFLMVGPAAVLPGADVPLVELAVLVLTILVLATFSRYAAMSFNTDAARMVQKLEELSVAEGEARQRDTEKVSNLFTAQTDRIVAKADAQIEATALGLSAATRQLERVATAIEKMTKLDEEAKAAAAEAARLQREALDQARRREETQLAEVARQAAARLMAIRPAVVVRIRFEGIIFHKIFLDVFNDGFDGVGLEAAVQIGPGVFRFTSATLGSKATRSFEVTDVTRVPAEAQILVRVGLRDVDANPYLFLVGPFRYVRDVGWLNRTKSLFVDPSSWVTGTVSGPGTR